MKNIKVEVKGKIYWLMADSLKQGGSLTLKNRCDDSGDPYDLLFGVSDAYYYPDRGVLCFGKTIASPEEVIEIK